MVSNKVKNRNNPLIQKGEGNVNMQIMEDAEKVKNVDSTTPPKLVLITTVMEFVILDRTVTSVIQFINVNNGSHKENVNEEICASTVTKPTITTTSIF